jgi:ankyrin repeat protein
MTTAIAAANAAEAISCAAALSDFTVPASCGGAPLPQCHIVDSVIHNDETALRKYLESGGNMHQVDRYSFNALMTAAMNHCNEALAFCIKHGVGRSINAAEPTENMTALHFAATRWSGKATSVDNPETLATLLHSGADLTLVAKCGTALHYAVNARFSDMVKFMCSVELAWKPDYSRVDFINYRNGVGKSALDLAIEYNYPEIIASIQAALTETCAVVTIELKEENKFGRAVAAPVMVKLQRKKQDAATATAATACVHPVSTSASVSVNATSAPAEAALPAMTRGSASASAGVSASASVSAGAGASASSSSSASAIDPAAAAAAATAVCVTGGDGTSSSSAQLLAAGSVVAAPVSVPYECPLDEYICSRARGGDLDTLNRFLPHWKAVDEQGRTILMNACAHRKEAVVKWYLQQVTAAALPTADKLKLINQQDNYGCTCVHFCASKPRQTGFDVDLPKCLELVVAVGADINARDRVGVTALHLSIQNGYELIVEWLLKNPATNPTILDIHGKDALKMAMSLPSSCSASAAIIAQITEAVRQSECVRNGGCECT